MRVLLLSTTTGYQLRSFGDAAHRLGIELVLATDRCHHLEDPWQDAAIPVRFYDDEASLQGILEHLASRPIGGIVSVGDRPATLAARVAQALSLPGNPLHSAEAARNKKAMRHAFAAAGLRVPWVTEIQAATDPQTIAPRLPYPCIVKPLGLSGSRGVIKADTPTQFADAVHRVRTLLARPQLQAQRTGLTDTLLVEGYIPGPEYAVEGVLTRGALRVFALFDKPDPLDGPFFEETIYVTPSDLPLDVQRAITGEVQRAAAALGLVHGPVHAECRVSPAGAVMLEIAARPIGGRCSQVLRFPAAGRLAPLEEVLLRHAAGEDVSLYAREHHASGVMMIPIPKRGVYKGARGEPEARAVMHVESVEITAKPDQLLEPLPEGDSYLGFIFARADTPADVVAALREAHRRLEFAIDPELRVIR